MHIKLKQNVSKMRFISRMEYFDNIPQILLKDKKYVFIIIKKHRVFEKVKKKKYLYKI